MVALLRRLYITQDSKRRGINDRLAYDHQIPGGRNAPAFQQNGCFFNWLKVDRRLLGRAFQDRVGRCHRRATKLWSRRFPEQSDLGASPSGKAPDFDSGIRRFESSRPSQCSPASQAEIRQYKVIGAWDLLSDGNLGLPAEGSRNSVVLSLTVHSKQNVVSIDRRRVDPHTERSGHGV